MEFTFNSIEDLNAYYFGLFEQTKGLIQSCDKHYFKYVQNLLVKRYKRDARRFAKQEKKEYKFFCKKCKKTEFDKILQELSLKQVLTARIDDNKDIFTLNRPTEDGQPAKANTGNQETGEQVENLAHETRYSLELPVQEDGQPQNQNIKGPIEEKTSQDDFLPL